MRATARGWARGSPLLARYPVSADGVGEALRREPPRLSDDSIDDSQHNFTWCSRRQTS
jgi:hypothetical protein